MGRRAGRSPRPKTKKRLCEQVSCPYFARCKFCRDVNACRTALDADGDVLVEEID